MSNPLLIKSEENLKASQLTSQNGYYASSIHSSYYSMFQMIKFIHLHRLKDSEVTSDHGQYFNKIIFTLFREFKNMKLKKNISQEEIDLLAIDTEILSSKLFNFKTLRNKADYKEIVMREEDSKYANETCVQINDILNRRFIQNSQ